MMARLFYFIQVKFNFFDKFKFKNLFPHTFAEASSSEDIGFRPLGEDRNSKGLSQLTRDKQIKAVFAMWLKDGFAKRLIEIIIDFVLGEEVTTDELKITSRGDLVSEEKLNEIKQIIEEFHDENELNTEFEKYFLDLLLNGMLIIPTFVNEYNGSVKLGFVDPTQLDTVISNPLNIKEIQRLKFKSTWDNPEKYLEVIRKQRVSDNPLSEKYDLLQGQAFYFAINNVSNQKEGVSELIGVVDLVNQLRRLLFNILEGTRLANLFVIDVEIKGANQKKVDQWKKDNPLPDGPVRWVHNDRIKQEIKATGLKTTDNSQTIRLFKNFILACMGYPPMWFADGEDANRAIALEQGTPTLKKLKKKQKLAIRVLKTFYKYALHQAFLYREGFTLSREELNSIDFEIKAPDLEVKNQEKISTVIEKITDSFLKAISAGLITKETAVATYLRLIQNLGSDLNVEAEIDKLNNAPEPQKQEPNPNSPQA